MGAALGLLIAVVALSVAVVGLRLLWGRRWLKGWLRGSLGLLLLTAGLLLALAAWDLQRYRTLPKEQAVASLAFVELAPGRYRVEFIQPGSEPQLFELRGDLWQLDVRLLKWDDWLQRWGARPSYRLERLSGRYFSLEDEQTAPRTVIGLVDQQTGTDLWPWLQRLEPAVPLVDAVYGSAAYLPMRDGARFAITAGATGLIARPINEPAEAAIESWR